MRYISLIISVFLLPSVVWAQTCNNNIIPTSPTVQFTINGDGTVTDNKMGLMWKRCMEGLSANDCMTGTKSTMHWAAALQQPETLNASGGFAGYTDWRLPNVMELESIIENKCELPAINLTVFPNAPENTYAWSSTAGGGGLGGAWGVGSGYGSTLSNLSTPLNSRRDVRLVRTK